MLGWAEKEMWVMYTQLLLHPMVYSCTSTGCVESDKNGC